jgi:hypothetical protein
MGGASSRGRGSSPGLGCIRQPEETARHRGDRIGTRREGSMAVKRTAPRLRAAPFPRPTRPLLRVMHSPRPRPRSARLESPRRPGAPRPLAGLRPADGPEDRLRALRTLQRLFFDRPARHPLRPLPRRAAGALTSVSRRNAREESHSARASKASPPTAGSAAPAPRRPPSLPSSRTPLRRLMTSILTPPPRSGRSAAAPSTTPPPDQGASPARTPRAGHP